MPAVPDRSTYDPELNAWLHTGENAVQAVVDLLHRRAPNSVHIAMDIETPGLVRNFEINCVTAAWEDQGQTHSVLLDPIRSPDLGQREAVDSLVDLASMLIFHNACFDVPALWWKGILDERAVRKIVDTRLLAYFGYPDRYNPHTGSKTLANLSRVLLGLSDDDTREAMVAAFKARGWTKAVGFERMDIDAPVYRRGAMFDTIATLRLQPVLREHAWAWTLNHPFVAFGATEHGQAEAILETQERVHRVMLLRTAKGISVDRDYLDRYSEQVYADRVRAEAQLAAHGLVGGAGKGAKIITAIAQMGELPDRWPKTPTGKPRATKDDLDALDHPLARAQRTLAETDKIMGYISKVDAQADVTGRCHPQVAVLGASATGRMAASVPEYQQFSENARPIFRSDNPDADCNVAWNDGPKGKPVPRMAGPDKQLWSIDWSQIEPVTMGLLARDQSFLDPYERGEDLYEPLMRAAGIVRDMAKVGLLADMYGQGEPAMARKLGLSREQAAQIRRQMRSAMPRCTRWMAKMQTIAETYEKIVTADGRVLPVPAERSYIAVNYEVQGSAYDFLATSIVEIDRAGLGHCIVLGMHDELVVDATADEAIEIEHIMLTAQPRFIVSVAGKEPLLRCDRQPTGRAWAKV